MAIYLVELPETARGTRKADAMYVSASDATDAKAIAKAKHSGDAGDAAWDAATATTITEVNIEDSAAMLGWRLRVVVTGAAALTATVDETVTGTGTDAIDELAALMVTALNGTADIANSAYTPNTLTISTIADGIGDGTAAVYLYPPIETDANGDQSNQDVSIPGIIGAITHEGIAGAALTVAFAADGTVLPSVNKVLQYA